MLPPESIRFFAVDPNWTAALVDGALSLAARTAPAAAAAAALRPAALAAATPPAAGYSGFLLRSALVPAWPGLRVTGYADPQAITPLATARLERLAPTVLLALFAGLVQRVDLAEPPQHLHAGVTAAAAPSVPLRLIDAASAGLPPPGNPTAPVTLRQDPDPGRTVIDIRATVAAVAAGLSAVYASLNQAVPQLGPAGLSLQFAQARPRSLHHRDGAVSGPGGGTWPGPALLVPVTVDALVLTAAATAGLVLDTPQLRSAQSFTPATRLFQANPPPAARPGQRPRPGAVVRWALPDALTAGGSADPQTGAVTFPPVPNRWLVARRCLASRAPARPGFWPATTSAATARPTTPAAGHTGHVLAAGRLARGGRAARRARPAADRRGPGRPAFAAYLPNIQHIFAFHDPLTGVNPGTVSYLVCGWYGGGVADPMSGPQTAAGWQTAADWAALRASSAGRRAATARPPRRPRRPGRPPTATLPTRPTRAPSCPPGPSATACLRGELAGPGRAGPVRRAGRRPGRPATMPRLTVAHTAPTRSPPPSAAESGTPDTEALSAVLTGLLPLLDEPDGDASWPRGCRTAGSSLPGGTSWRSRPGKPRQAARRPPG